MGADSIIVNAAFKEALSKAGAVVPDMSNVIKGQVKVSKTYLGGITGVFADMKKNREELEAAQNTQLQAFKAQAKKSAQYILKYEQSQPMKLHDAIYDKFKALEKEFELYNTTGDDDNADNEKMRANLYAQLQMITNQAVKSRGVIATIGTMAEDIVPLSASAQDLAVGRAIMGVDGNYDNIELSFDETGQLVYHVLLEGMSEPVSWTIDDFNDKIIAHNRKFDVYTQKAKAEALRKGLAGEPWNEEDKLLEKDNYVQGIVKNERDFLDAAYSKMNGKKSWVSSLYDINEDTVNIATKAIEYLFTEDMMDKISLADVDEKDGITMFDMDRDGDNKITKDDLKNLSTEAQARWQANIESIIGALTKVEHPAFNLDRSASLLGDYYMKGLGEEYQKGFDNQPSNISEKSIGEREKIALSKRINKLLQQEVISLSDINALALGTGSSPVTIVRDGKDYKVVRDNKWEIDRFSVNDRKALQNAIYQHTGLGVLYQRDLDFSGFVEQVPGAGIYKPGYQFSTGEVESR